MMKYILGIDVGGSKITAAIASSDGEILSSENSAGAIYTETGIDGLIIKLSETAEKCAEKAGISVREISVGVFGMTGVDWDFEKKLHEDAIKKAFPSMEKIVVRNDSIIAFYAGSVKSYGAILCLGTGFNAASIDTEGKSFVFGFYERAPHCGGKSLARKTIRAVCSSHVGLYPPTLLTDAVLKHLSAENTDELLMNFLKGQYKKNVLVKIPAIVFSYYSRGDSVSEILVDSLCKELSEHAVAALKNLKLENSNPDIVISGGMLKNSPEPILEKVRRNISEDIQKFDIFYSKYEPVFGALKMGLIELSANQEQVASLYSSASSLPSMIRTS